MRALGWIVPVLLATGALLSGRGGGDADEAPEPWSGATIREPTEADTYSTDATAPLVGGVSFVPGTYYCSLIGGSLPLGYEVRWHNDANGDTGSGQTRIYCFPFVLVTWTTFHAPLAMGSNPISVTVGLSVDNRVGSDTITVTRVADTTPPTVSAVTPVPDAVSVPQSTDLVVVFDEIIDTTALDRGQVTLVEVATSAPVPLTFVPSVNQTIVMMRPTSPLAADALHEIRLSGIADLAGNAMAAIFSSRFRTATLVVDNAPPTVVALDPPREPPACPLAPRSWRGSASRSPSTAWTSASGRSSPPAAIRCVMQSRPSSRSSRRPSTQTR